MKKSLLILLSILIVGLFLRVFKVASYPLYGDELTIVQDASSILHTGKDVNGKAFPLTFSMGAGRPGGYVYASVPFVAVFGENAYGVRGLSILSGLGLIVLMYLLAKRLFSAKAGLIAAFLTAVSPWGLNLSRGGFEANFAIFLALSGVLLFLSGQKKPFYYVFSAFVWGLTIFTYPTYKLVLPLFIPVLIWFTGGVRNLFKGTSKNYLIAAILIGLLFGGLSLKESLKGGSESRFLSINVFAQEDLKKQVAQKVFFDRKFSGLPLAVSRLFHNKNIEYFDLLKNGYLANFSVEYLFVSGDGNPRHNMTQSGVLFVVEIVLIILGLTYLIKNNKKRETGLIAWWLLLSPLATALILLPHSLRNAFMFPALTLLSTLGVLFILEIKNKKSGMLIFSLIAAAWFIQAVFMYERLYFVSPSAFPRAWSVPAKTASDLAISEKANFDYVILSDKIDSVEYAYPVYAMVPAVEVIDQNLKRDSLIGASVKRFGNVYIGYFTPEQIIELMALKGKKLFIGNLNSDGRVPESKDIIGYEDPTQSIVIARWN